jgi:hypothetical protein
MGMDPERGLSVTLLTCRANSIDENQTYVQLCRADVVLETVTDVPLIDWKARRPGTVR